MYKRGVFSVMLIESILFLCSPHGGDVIDGPFGETRQVGADADDGERADLEHAGLVDGRQELDDHLVLCRLDDVQLHVEEQRLQACADAMTSR